MDRLEWLLARFEAEYLELHSITPLRRQTQKRVLRNLAAAMDAQIGRAHV